MCMLYVSIGSKVRSRTVWCVAMGSTRVWSEQSASWIYDGIHMFCPCIPLYVGSCVDCDAFTVVCV